MHDANCVCVCVCYVSSKKLPSLSFVSSILDLATDRVLVRVSDTVWSPSTPEE